MNSASLFSLAGRYDNSIPTWFLAPIDFLKIPAQLDKFTPYKEKKLHASYSLLEIEQKLRYRPKDHKNALMVEF
jgi:hypothetical protein